MSSGAPPSSFTRTASSTSTSSSLKRHSLPPSPSPGPRPLHLVDLGATSSVLSPSRHSLTASPLHSPSVSVGPISRSATPLSAKRQSSLSYFAPNHESTRELKRSSSPLHLPSTPGSAGGLKPNDGRIRASIDSVVPISRSVSASKVVDVSVVDEPKERPPMTAAEKYVECIVHLNDN